MTPLPPRPRTASTSYLLSRRVPLGKSEGWGVSDERPLVDASAETVLVRERPGLSFETPLVLCRRNGVMMNCDRGW